MAYNIHSFESVTWRHLNGERDATLHGARDTALTGAKDTSLHGEKDATLHGERAATLNSERDATLRKECHTPSDSKSSERNGKNYLALALFAAPCIH